MKIYLLEEVYFESLDLQDGERNEIRLTEGFWVDHKKYVLSQKRIEKELADGWTLEETTFDLSINNKQKYLYVLNYEYFTADDTCFYYQFAPCTSKKKCLLLKEEKMKEEKFKANTSKIIRRGKDGWFIEKYEIVF